MRTLDTAGIPLAAIELHRPSLDDVFLTKTGRSLRDVVSLLAQAAIITSLALVFGLRVHIGYLLLAYLCSA